MMNDAGKPAMVDGRKRVALGGAIVVAAVVVAAIPSFPAFRTQMAHLQFAPHLPRLSTVLAETPAIQLHLWTALAAVGVGAVPMAGPKGRTLHRVLGWFWALCMGATAIASFFIHTINPGGPGGLSIIHALAAWTLVGLPIAVMAARRRDVAKHRRAMMGMFYGGLLVAGVLTFIPGRLMWRLFLG